MFAVIKTGGKQYRVAARDVIEVEKLAGSAGDGIAFAEVLMVGGEDAAPTIGSPLIDGASVAAEIVEQRRGKKVIAFKKRRRKNSKRKRGHRQELTLVRITEILAAGAQPAKKAKAEAGTEEAAAAPAPKRRQTTKPAAKKPKAKE
jgi:large subunit ribosomal protein L21